MRLIFMVGVSKPLYPGGAMRRLGYAASEVFVNKTKKAPSLVEEIRGASRLAIEATRGVTDLVEAMHQTIAAGPKLLGQPLAGVARALTSPVYTTIRGITGLVGAGIDAALGELSPLLGSSAPGPEREAVVAALNGVLGDYLEASGNPLTIAMKLRCQGHELASAREELAEQLPDARSRLLVLVHGSCMNDKQWLRQGHDHGAALAAELSQTPVYLHYNSGLHVSTNGLRFAQSLQALYEAWPVPIEGIVIVAHSMGGLLTRSACHVAEGQGLSWRQKLSAIVFLGTPHHGAPLERQGNWIDVLLGVSRYSAPLARLGKIRSAGVTDLRFGNVLDEHWQGRDRFAKEADPRQNLALPEGVACYAIAASTASEPGDALPGDGLVPIDSALGHHDHGRLSLEFPADRQWIGMGMNHLDLLSHPEVYEKMRAWLGTGRPLS